MTVPAPRLRHLAGRIHTLGPGPLAEMLIELSAGNPLMPTLDHDANGAGERAAAEVASRWREAGKEARVWKPKSKGDLNDMFMGGAK